MAHRQEVKNPHAGCLTNPVRGQVSLRCQEPPSLEIHDKNGTAFWDVKANHQTANQRPKNLEKRNESRPSSRPASVPSVSDTIANRGVPNMATDAMPPITAPVRLILMA